MAQNGRDGSHVPSLRRGTSLVLRQQPGVPGRPIRYQPAAYDIDDSWRLVSPSMREWAEQRAGKQIRDPHTKQPTVYWYCNVTPSLTDGPRGAAVPAAYDLVMFGQRALVVSSGTTEALDPDDGGTRWRHARYDVPVDVSGLAHDHRRAIGQMVPPDTGQGDEGAAADAGDAGDAASGPLTARVAAVFGNLPLATQRFLLAPFAADGPSSTRANVHATTRVLGDRYEELLWTYLFDADRLAFAHGRRSVRWRSGLVGPALWSGSPEAEELAGAPWAVAAWSAPRLPASDGRPEIEGRGAGAGP